MARRSPVTLDYTLRSTLWVVSLRDEDLVFCPVSYAEGRLTGLVCVSSWLGVRSAACDGSIARIWELDNRTRPPEDNWPAKAGAAYERNSWLARSARLSAVPIVTGLSRRSALRAVKIFLSDAKLR